MRRAGLWLEFAPRSELDAWLQSADAFLVPMVFEEKYRQRMETSFPSKLIEFAQFGKPLIVWGPEYCSAVQWGRESQKVLCVTEASVAKLLTDIEFLFSTPGQRCRLAGAAREAAMAEFHSGNIQRQFINALDMASIN